MPSKVFKSKRHDTGTYPEVVLGPPPGWTGDLTEAGITATFIARLPDAEAPKIEAPATVTGPWTVTYAPTPADVDTIGSYDVEVEVIRANGKKFTFPTDDPGSTEALVWRIGTDLNNT